ncbi:MAG: sporulation protein YqfD [Oscillospiraceae bacterium]|nr:sporulation protein YqfD [Oscillospiraceae bacterium]
MFFLNFIRYLRGYVRFSAAGDFVERFLNLSARDHIAIWGGKKSGGEFSGHVSAQSYRRLRRHAKKTGVKIKIREKHGVPFTRYKYRHRHGILAGAALFALFLAVMSLFIWRIEVGGLEGGVRESDILRTLEGLGIRPGVLRAGIDVRDSERRALLLLQDLSWVALNIDGSTLHVEVSERSKPPEMIDPDRPCNITAAMDGQLVALNAYDGQPLAKIGDTVREGQIIVSGITQDSRDKTMFRHARAQAFAVVNYTIETAVPLEQTGYAPTGKSRSRSYINAAGLQIPLFLPISIPHPYYVERAESVFAPFGTALPFSVLKERYVLMEEIPITLTKDEAKEEALAQLNAAQRVQLEGAEIRSTNLTGMEKDGHYILRADYICVMDIAVQREIYLEGS